MGAAAAGGAAISATNPDPTTIACADKDKIGAMGGAGGPGQKSLLVPVRQWRAHETRISSIAGASYHGKADLLVTAGVDCYVHLWTVAGAHIGTFGQVSVFFLSSMHGGSGGGRRWVFCYRRWLCVCYMYMNYSTTTYFVLHFALFHKQLDLVVDVMVPLVFIHTK